MITENTKPAAVVANQRKISPTVGPTLLDQTVARALTHLRPDAVSTPVPTTATEGTRR